MKPLSSKANVVAKRQNAISLGNTFNTRSRLFFLNWLHSYFELCTTETLTGIQAGSLILDTEYTFMYSVVLVLVLLVLRMFLSRTPTFSLSHLLVGNCAINFS